MNYLYKSIFLSGGALIFYFVFQSLKNKEMSKFIFGPMFGPQKNGVCGYVVLALHLLLADCLFFSAYHV